MTRRLTHVFHREWWTWLFGVLTTIAGHNAAASLLEFIEEGRSSKAFTLWFGAFIALTTAFYWIYENPFPQRLARRLRWRAFWEGLLPWLVADVAALFLFIIAVMTHRGISSVLTPTCLWSAGAFAIYVFIFFKLRRSVMVIHTRYLRSEKLIGDTHADVGARHVVAILTNATDFRDNDYLPRGVTFTGDLNADLDALAALKRSREAGMPRSREWPWEMILRALRPHRESVRELTLVCSLQSLPEAPRLAEILHSYESLRRVDVSVWAEKNGIRELYPADAETISGQLPAGGFDFFDLDQLSSALTDLMRYLQVEKHLHAHELVIDFTGGTKPASVVAAALTLRGDISAQYVDTADPWPVTMYDLAHNPEVGGGA